MTWKYVGIVLVLVLGGVFFFVFPTGDTHDLVNFPPGDGPIVAFGDSLVHGVGADTPGGFVTLLERRVGEPIVNLGRGGDTTADGLVRVTQVLDHSPRITLVLLGGNDFLARIPKETTFQNLETIITQLQDNGSLVVLLGVRGGIIFDGYESGYRKLARETGAVHVSDVLYGLFGNPTFMDDAIHPNEMGYEIIAGRVYEAIEDIL